MKPTWGLVATHWVFAAVCLLGLAGAYHLYASNTPQPKAAAPPIDDGGFVKGLSDADLAAELVVAEAAWREIARNVTNIDAAQPNDNHAAAVYRRFAKLRKESDARAKRP